MDGLQLIRHETRIDTVAEPDSDPIGTEKVAVFSVSDPRRSVDGPLPTKDHVSPAQDVLRKPVDHIGTDPLRSFLDLQTAMPDFTNRDDRNARRRILSGLKHRPEWPGLDRPAESAQQFAKSRTRHPAGQF